VIHTLHDYSLMCPKASMYQRGVNCAGQCTVCRAYSLPGKLMSTHVDAVVGVSRHMLNQHLRAGYFSHAAVRRIIYNGLPSAPQDAVAARPRAGAPLRLGFVGRLTPNKGIGELVAQMHEWTGRCELVVGGTGNPDYERELRSRAPANVRFLGFVDPAQVYRDIDVLVVPSLWHDPLPTTVLEAYQYGLPVIASARGGLPEIVEHGRTGFLFEPDDPAGLQRSIHMFAHDCGLAAQMRPEVARKSASFTLERMRSEYLELLMQAVQHAPSTAVQAA
jgi:glycosyltransferase involved in cell wall biosynthesis